MRWWKKLSSLSWNELVKCLRGMGFQGPYSKKGGKHPLFMIRGTTKLRIPNKHKNDIHLPLLKDLKKQGSISETECKIA
jgi:hypothetical protein